MSDFNRSEVEEILKNLERKPEVNEFLKTLELTPEVDTLLKTFANQYSMMLTVDDPFQNPATQSYGTIYKAIYYFNRYMERILIFLILTILTENKKLSIKTAKCLLFVHARLFSRLEQMQPQR